MSSTPDTHSDLNASTVRGRKRRIAGSLAVVAIAATSLTALSSGAWFTDSDTIPNNSFSTGEVKIDATPDSAVLTLANMAPGDTVVAPITVKNTGSLAETYTVTGQASGTLSPALRTTIKTGVTCTEAGFNTGGSTVYAAAAVPTTATQLASRGSLNAAASEVLCFQVQLPGSTTSNTYQNTTSTLTFTFDGIQSANRP